MKIANKKLISGVILSILLFITGFFLRAILFPIQDIDTMSKAELLELQKEMAINYPLGTTLHYLGIVLFFICVFLLIAGRRKK